MNNHIFTLVSYRPNGVDTCRGCVMGTSNSEFNVFTSRNVKEVIERLVKNLVEDAFKGYEVCTWEHFIIIDGYTEESDWYEQNDSVRNDREQLRIHINTAAKELSVTKIEEKKQQILDEKMMKQLKQQQEQEAKERAQLKSLQEKYGE